MVQMGSEGNVLLKNLSDDECDYNSENYELLMNPLVFTT